MSWVTAIMLTTEHLAPDGGNDPGVDALNKWLREEGTVSGGQLVRIDNHAGGTKTMEVDLYAAGFNHLNLEDFVNAFYGIDWDLPECVQLFARDQYDDLFRVYTPDRKHRTMAHMTSATKTNETEG